MNPWPYLISIFVFALIHAGLVAASCALDYFRVRSEEKLTFYRTSVLTLLASPFLFLLLKVSSWRTIDIVIPYRAPIGNAAAAATALTYEAELWPLYLLYAYLAVVGASLLWILISYCMAKSKLSSAESHQAHGRQVWLNDFLQTPFCFGLFWPKVYVPKESVGMWSKTEEVASISHESIHARRRDPLWKMLSLIVRSLVFFSPLAHHFHRKMDIEMEIFCDSETLKETGLTWKEYGGVLLNTIQSQPRIWLATNINESNLRKRIEAMKSNSISSPFLKACACFVSLLLGLTAVAATSGIIEKRNAYMISTEIFLNDEKISSPKIGTLENELATISQMNADGEVEMKIEVLAYNYPLSAISKKYKGEGIRLDLDVFYQSSGVTFHSQPQIVTVPNEEALIQIGEGENVYTMKVVVTRH